MLDEVHQYELPWTQCKGAKENVDFTASRIREI